MASVTVNLQLLTLRKYFPNLMENKFFDKQSHWDILINEGKELVKFFPQLYDIGIKYCMSNVCSYSVDGDLIIGESVCVKGFYAATGCSGGGIAFSGGVGKIVNKMLHQRCEAINAFDRFAIERLSIDPFSQEFLQRCSQTRSTKRDG